VTTIVSWHNTEGGEWNPVRQLPFQFRQLAVMVTPVIASPRRG
jgi:hypothetical protein